MLLSTVAVLASAAASVQGAAITKRATCPYPYVCPASDTQNALLYYDYGSTAEMLDCLYNDGMNCSYDGTTGVAIGSGPGCPTAAMACAFICPSSDNDGNDILSSNPSSPDDIVCVYGVYGFSSSCTYDPSSGALTYGNPDPSTCPSTAIQNYYPGTQTPTN